MFKAEFSDDRGKSYASNALRFPTREAAEAYARELFFRWLGATDWRIAETDDDPAGFDERGFPVREAS